MKEYKIPESAIKRRMRLIEETDNIFLQLQDKVNKSENIYENRTYKKTRNKNVFGFLRRKYVGVDLFDGRIRAYEKEDNIFIDKSMEEVFPDLLTNINNESYWHDYNIMKQLLIYVLSNTKKSLSKPVLFIAFPFQISQSKVPEIISDAASQTKCSRVILIDNFLCLAAGTRVILEEPKRKIFICSRSNITYVGLIFAGGAFNVRILEKGYNQLTRVDIENNIKELINVVSIELPNEFMRLPKKTLEELTTGWKLEIEKIIYVAIPSDLTNSFGFSIGEYKLVYLENENIILEGLKKIILDRKGTLY